MSQWQGYGATVSIIDGYLVIERGRMQSFTMGQQAPIALGDLAGLHIKAPSRLMNGWVQLCLGGWRAELGRGGAPSDPHTVMFKWGHRDQMEQLVAYLRQVVAYNHAQPQPSTQRGGGPSFVGFDVETANGARGSICAIGLTVVAGGLVTGTHSWLCRPPEGLDRFDPGNILIHGIQAHEVANQPTFRQRLGDMLDIVGDLPLVAHNAEFDISALREASAAESVTWRPLTYGCTLAWSRSDLPDLPNHKLPTVAAALGVSLRQHHDASADASAAAEIALELMRRRSAVSVDDYALATGIALGRATVDATTGTKRYRGGVPTWVAVQSSATPPAANEDADPEHPLFGHTVVITGSLTGASKEEAWSQLAKCGAHVNKTVTRRTSVLVAGAWLDDNGNPAVTEKKAHARRLLAAGQKIAIINQTEMDTLLAGARCVALPDLIMTSILDPYALADDSHIAPNSRNDSRQLVRGKHFTAWVEPVKQLKRDGRLDEALVLLLECIEVAGMAPWYTEQAAIIHRKQKNYAAEIALLQRWLDTACHSHGIDLDPFTARLTKARALVGLPD